MKNHKPWELQSLVRQDSSQSILPSFYVAESTILGVRRAQRTVQVWLVNNEAVLKTEGKVDLKNQHFVRWWLRHQAALVFPIFTGAHKTLLSAVSLVTICNKWRTKYDELVWCLLQLCKAYLGFFDGGAVAGPAAGHGLSWRRGGIRAGALDRRLLGRGLFASWIGRARCYCQEPPGSACNACSTRDGDGM